MVDSVSVEDGVLIAALKSGVKDYTDLSSLLITEGHRLKMFREEEVDLESAFMALTKGLDNQNADED